MDIYRPKQQKIEAEKLESDITIKHHNINSSDFYLQGGNYLIKGPDGLLYPANKNLFEFLFEKCMEEEIYE